MSSDVEPSGSLLERAPEKHVRGLTAAAVERAVDRVNCELRT